MTMIRRTRFLWVLILLVGPWQSVCLAQAPSFTKAQVSAGRRDYRTHCASCHGPRMQGEHLSPPLVGARFDQAWRGKSAGVLAFHLRRMPPEPRAKTGNLGDETYANILAYILKTNGLETGDVVLPSDLDALGELSIPKLAGVKYDPDAPVVAAGQSELLNSLPAVTDEMLRNPSPNDWLHTGGTYDGQTYSPLKLINRENVGDLALAWRAPLRNGNSMPMPLIHQSIDGKRCKPLTRMN